MDQKASHSASSSNSTMNRAARNLARGKGRAKILVGRVQESVGKNLPVIFGIGGFFFVMYFFATFGPSFIDIIKSLVPLLAVMGLIGVIAFSSYGDMQREPQNGGQQFGEELYEYIFKPSPEFEQAYPNHPYHY